jgi:hypothetical protein
MKAINLDKRIKEAPSNQPLGIKYNVFQIRSDLILGKLLDETFILHEGNHGRSSFIPLFILNNIDFFMITMPNTYTTVSGSEIDSNSLTLWLEKKIGICRN